MQKLVDIQAWANRLAGTVDTDRLTKRHGQRAVLQRREGTSDGRYGRGQTSSEADREVGGKAGRGKQVGRQAGRQSGRQAGRQI